MSKIYLSLLIFVFIFGLFVMVGTAQAASSTVYWDSPISYDAINNPQIYQLPGSLTVSGYITATGCGNNGYPLTLHFSVETVTNGIKNFTELVQDSGPNVGEPFTTYPSADGSQYPFSVTFALPANTYVGLNIIMLNYYGELWGGYPSGYKTLTRTIRISDTPTAPVLTVYPATPAISDSLSCIIAGASTTGDPYNYCVDPYNCTCGNGGACISPITYTYQWYKNNFIQNTYTTANTINTLNIISPTTVSGQSWQCKVYATSSVGIQSNTITSSSMVVQ